MRTYGSGFFFGASSWWFKEAGFLADDRPLKVRPTPGLHIIPQTTLFFALSPLFPSCSCIAHFSTLHTVAHCSGQRHGPGAARRILFSFTAFPEIPDGSNGFGIWAVDELQICEMGSWAPDGAYVRVVIIDQARDVPHGDQGKPFSAAGRYL